MSGHEQILERAQRCNPVSRLETIHESDLADLDSLLHQRRSAMTDTTKLPSEIERPTVLIRRRLRPAIVFAAALVLTLGAVGAVTLFTGDDGGVVIDTPVATVEPVVTPAPTVDPEAGATDVTTTEPPAQTPLGRPVIETRIHSIAFDAVGTAWVIGDGELFVLVDETWTTVELPDGFADPGVVQFDTDGAIWMTAEVGGIARYEDGEWTTYEPPEEFEYDGATVFAGGGCGPALAIGTDGDVWAICPDMLMQLVDGEIVPAEVFGELAGGWWLMAGPDGTTYKTEFADLLVYDGTEWSEHDCPAPGPSMAGCAQLLGIDSDGDLWVAVGFEGFDGLARFSTPGYVPELVTGGALGAVDMAQTGDGDLWFAVPEYDEWDLAPEQTSVPDPGLYRFDGASWRRYTTDNGLSHNSISQVEVAPDGTLWVGASLWKPVLGDDGLPIDWESEGGLDVYDPALDRFTPLGGTP